MFRKEISQKHKNGGALIKQGGVLASGPILNVLEGDVASGGSNPARAATTCHIFSIKKA